MRLAHFFILWHPPFPYRFFSGLITLIEDVVSEDLKGGFQLLDLITTKLKIHMLLIGWNNSIQNLVKDFFWQIKFPPMGDLEFLTGYVTFKLRYNQI